MYLWNKPELILGISSIGGIVWSIKDRRMIKGSIGGGSRIRMREERMKDGRRKNEGREEEE